MRVWRSPVFGSVSGRIGGAEIDRSETYKEGTIPLRQSVPILITALQRLATTYG
jgi:ribosomal protein S3